MKTIGAVLNEASEANMRDMDNNRRSALTSVQLKGQVADQRYQEEQRGREREYLDGVRNIYNEEMFVKKPAQAQPSGAIPTPDADGNFPAQQFVTEAIDPSSRPGMEAISRVQMRTVALRQKLGLAKPEEIQGLVDFRRKVEAYGVADDFKRAFGGDADAVKRIADQFKLEGLQSVQSGQDEMGFLNIFAVSTKPDGTKTRVPIGHLAAAFSPEIDQMIKGSREAIKAGDERLNSESTRRYQDRQGLAAIENARANSARSTERAIANETHDRFEKRLADDPKKYVAPSRFTDMEGKEILDDQASGYLNEFGLHLIENEGYQAGKALMTARTALAQINSQALRVYESELEKARKAGDTAKVADMEDNGVNYWRRYRDWYADRLLQNYANQGSAANAGK
jgi:hypothetical protein